MRMCVFLLMLPSDNEEGVRWRSYVLVSLSVPEYLHKWGGAAAGLRTFVCKTSVRQQSSCL